MAAVKQQKQTITFHYCCIPTTFRGDLTVISWWQWSQLWKGPLSFVSNDMLMSMKRRLHISNNNTKPTYKISTNQFCSWQFFWKKKQESGQLWFDKIKWKKESSSTTKSLLCFALLNFYFSYVCSMFLAFFLFGQSFHQRNCSSNCLSIMPFWMSIKM